MVTWLGGSGELAWFNMATAGGARRWGTVSFDKDRLSHWCAIPLVVWTAGTFFLYIPFFHFLLGVSLVKVAVCSGLGCAGHLIVTPLLFSGRATAQNPSGDIIQTATAVIVWLSLSVLLIFCYLQHDWPRDSNANTFRACAYGVTIVFAVGALVAVRVFAHRLRSSQSMSK
jgi:hypothetical protein